MALYFLHGVLAQLVRAPACHVGGRGFKSLTSRHRIRRTSFCEVLFVVSTYRRGIVTSPTQSWPIGTPPFPAIGLEEFQAKVNQRGATLYRDLPWRNTRDPYAIWVSEVMLQQTQVSRVNGRWQHWLERFPTVEALAYAEQADVLDEWQGMGYNRRALALIRASQSIAEAGAFPQDETALRALPGIGPATAAGIRAFAFNLPGVYLETNVRTVFLHELFPQEVGVADRTLIPLVDAACPTDDARTWYYALLDYGAWLKRTVPNPSRRSRAHVRQSKFEGSHRQKRATVVRLLLAARKEGVDESSVAQSLQIPVDDARSLLDELTHEGFCTQRDARWFA